MGTTSTLPTVTDALLTLLNANLTTTTAFEAWPGPDAAEEMVVLGEADWDVYEIASIKAGRKHRQEVYGIGWEIFVMGAPGTTPANPKPARDRAFVLMAELEDALADDPRAGLAASVVQRIECRPDTSGPRVFEKGWGYRIAGQFVVHDRLT